MHFDFYIKGELVIDQNNQQMTSYENNVTIFRRKTNEVVQCPICEQNCSEPIEILGYRNLSAARANVLEKLWESHCNFLENEDHQEAQILWERLHSCISYYSNPKWTKREKLMFTSQLDELRAQIKEKIRSANNKKKRKGEIREKDEEDERKKGKRRRRKQSGSI